MNGLSIFLIACLVYGNTLFNGFVFDDIQIIADRLGQFNLGMIPGLFLKSYWSPASGIYRPLTMASFALNRVLFGTSPWAFHLINLLLHAINSVLIFNILKKLFGLNRQKTAWAAAAIFAVLPIHTEAVAAIVGRAEVLAMIFALLFWRAHIENKNTKAVLFLALALFSKESALMIIPLAWLWDQTNGKNLLKQYIPYFAISLVWFGFRWMALGRLGIDPDYQYFSGASFLTRILTMSHFSITRYLWPMATGLNLCADFSRWSIPDASTNDLLAWSCLAFWISISLVCFIRLVSSYSKLATRNSQLATFFLTWPFIAMLPTSNLIMLITPIGAERFLYMPSLAFGVLVALLIEKINFKNKVQAFILPLIFLYSGLTLARNLTWKNQKTLFEDTVTKVPQNFLAHNLLGVALAKEGNLDEGINELQKALALYPGHQSVLANLTTAYKQKGDLEATQQTLKKWIKSAPENPKPYRLLTDLLNSQKSR